eukprot:101066_1
MSAWQLIDDAANKIVDDELDRMGILRRPRSDDYTIATRIVEDELNRVGIPYCNLQNVVHGVIADPSMNQLMPMLIAERRNRASSGNKKSVAKRKRSNVKKQSKTTNNVINNIKLKKDGTIDKRCKAYVNQSVRLRKNGGIDKRCKAYKQQKQMENGLSTDKKHHKKTKTKPNRKRSNISQYSVGNTVLLCKQREGIVRYVGPVEGRRGTFYGIELTKGNGDTDGSIKTKRYFKCSAGKGKFVPAGSIMRKKSKTKKRKRRLSDGDTSDTELQSSTIRTKTSTPCDVSKTELESMCDAGVFDDDFVPDWLISKKIKGKKSTNSTLQAPPLKKRNTRTHSDNTNNRRATHTHSGIDIEQVKALFHSTVSPAQYEIIEIKDVSKSNAAHHNIYQSILKSKGTSLLQIEKYLWHGTGRSANDDVLDLILKNGFDRSYNKKGVYGSGTYFARDASYPVNRGFCGKDTSDPNVRFILLCRVIVGEYTTGNKNMKTIPKKDDGTEYESLVNSISDPTIFVSWRDYHAIPYYLIRFRRKWIG